MKKLLLSLATLLLTSNIVMANPAEPEPVVIITYATFTYQCLPTPIVLEQLAQNNMKKSLVVGSGAAGEYQKWTGVQDGIKVWLLMFKAPNGLTCKIDDSNNAKPPEAPTLEDLKKIK